MKRLKKLKDNQKVLAVFGILGLVLALVGVTYAFFSYAKEGSTENTLKSGSITFWYDEQNREGNSISIVDALPLTDEVGKNQTQAFNFKISSTSSSNNTIPYEITLRQKEGTDNIGDKIKVYLAKTSSIDASIASEEEVELSLFSSLSNVVKNGYSEKLLHTDMVPASDSAYTQFYRLKMWVDENADFSDGTLSNKTFTVTVNVYANGHVLDENSNVATVNSISVGGNELAKVSTENGIDTYSYMLPEGTTSTTLEVDAGERNQVTVTKTESDYQTPVANSNNIQRLSNTIKKKVNLTEGANYFKVVVTSESGTDISESHIKISIGKKLNQQILLDNPTVYTNPTLTKSASTAGDPSGLYSMDVTNGFGGANGTTYYFRGNVENNKVKFAGFDWRIIRINEDGTVRLILDGSIDDEKHSFSSTTKLYYEEATGNGEIKTLVDAWYTANIIDNFDNSVVLGNFCQQLKTGASGTRYDSRIELYNEYTPNFNCDNDFNDKGNIRLKAGLITYDEMLFAGAYPHELNNSFYLYKDYDYWTMSPAGKSVHDLYYIWSFLYSNYSLDWNGTNKTYRIRPVINLKADLAATGSGTSDDPYVIQ